MTQHIRDANLLAIIAEYFGCGKIYNRSEGLACDLIVNTFPDNINLIIPFFEKYPIITLKDKDFKDFSLAAKYIKNKEHLTLEGLNIIRDIKASMNTNRK